MKKIIRLNSSDNKASANWNHSEGNLVEYSQREDGTSVGIVILAAGASTRMGMPKQLLVYQGRSLLRHAVETAIASVCRPVIVVLGADLERLQHEIKDLTVQVIENPRWAEGMGSSIQVGINALEAASDKVKAAVIALCDQPLISSQTLTGLVEAYYSIGKPIVASEYRGARGVPALFSRELFSELMALKGDQGAKQVIMRYSHEVFCVPVPEGAVDVDTPKDYEQLCTEEFR